MTDGGPALNYVPHAPLTFTDLRREGLALAQRLCGEIWTDYNTHDPGVTILEQICYALTDVAYRAGFDVADYLTRPTESTGYGRIDFSRQGLELPDAIYPSRPTTAEDYRKLLIGNIPDVENAWLRPLTSAGTPPNPRGLYDVLLQAVPNLRDKKALERQVRSLCEQHRNLCEDFRYIEILEEQSFDFSAEVEVSTDHDPTAVLAEIYYVCSCAASQAVRVSRFDSVVAREVSLEAILRGVIPPHGLCDEEALAATTDQMGSQGRDLPSLFYGLISELPGVEYIRWLEVGDIDTSADHCLRLNPSGDDAGITLTHHGHPIPVNVRELRSRLSERQFAATLDGRASDDPKSLYRLPTGQLLTFGEYPPLARQFPQNYQLTETKGANGDSSWGPRRTSDVKEREKRQATARQLNAYLVLFDQLMANYAANVESLSDLFSINLSSNKSYFAKALNAQTYPFLEAIYPSPEIIDAVLAEHDNGIERRNRVADHLLALYGESYDGKPFIPTETNGDSQRCTDESVRNKFHFIREIATLSRDRNGGNPWDANGRAERHQGFKFRLLHELGLAAPTSSLNRAFENESIGALAEFGYQVVSNEHYVNALVARGDLIEPTKMAEALIPNSGESPVLYELSRFSLRELGARFGPYLPRRWFLSQNMLRKGVNYGRYWLGQGTDYRWKLFFGVEGTSDWCAAGAFSNKAEAEYAARGLFTLLSRIRGPRLEVVEHILLRPHQSRKYALGRAPYADFFSLRVSVLLPDPCRDDAFQQSAEQIVARACPSHIVPTVLWLDFAKMCEFQTLYSNWCELRATAQDDRENLDVAAEAVTAFIASQAPRATQSAWFRASENT